MAEQVSKKITPMYTVTVNGDDFNADESYDLPVELANEVERLARVKWQDEQKRMNGQAPVNSYIQHMG